jgi:hypothetical protein
VDQRGRIGVPAGAWSWKNKITNYDLTKETTHQNYPAATPSAPSPGGTRRPWQTSASRRARRGRVEGPFRHQGLGRERHPEPGDVARDGLVPNCVRAQRCPLLACGLTNPHASFLNFSGGDAGSPRRE